MSGRLCEWCQRKVASVSMSDVNDRHRKESFLDVCFDCADFLDRSRNDCEDAHDLNTCLRGEPLEIMLSYARLRESGEMSPYIYRDERNRKGTTPIAERERRMMKIRKSPDPRMFRHGHDIPDEEDFTGFIGLCVIRPDD